MYAQMGGETLLILHQKFLPNRCHVDVNEIATVLSQIQKRRVEKYSFEEFTETDSSKFWKVLIIHEDASVCDEEVGAVIKRFDNENARVLTQTKTSLFEEYPVKESLVISTEDWDDIALWWPRVLQFLLPNRQIPNNKSCDSCLFLFDGNVSLQNQEELRWFTKMRDVLQPLGVQCMSEVDIEKRLVDLDGKAGRRGVRPDFIVVLCRNSSLDTPQKTGHLLRRDIKTVVLTDNENSRICQSIEKFARKNYVYQAENPMEFGLIGWSVLLTQLNIVKCLDAVVKDGVKGSSDGEGRNCISACLCGCFSRSVWVVPETDTVVNMSQTSIQMRRKLPD